MTAVCRGFADVVEFGGVSFDLAVMLLAVLVHPNGCGSSFQCENHVSIASMKSATR